MSSLQPFGDPEAEAQALLDMHTPGEVVQLITAYDNLLRQLEDAKNGGLERLDAFIAHATKVRDILKSKCSAGDRI